MLTRLVPPGRGLVRVSLAGCVITQTLVAVGASFALAGVHAAAGTADAGLIAFGWRGLWLTFTASAVPTIMFTVTGYWDCGKPAFPRHECPPWAGYRRRRT